MVQLQKIYIYQIYTKILIEFCFELLYANSTVNVYNAKATHVNNTVIVMLTGC